MNSQIVINGLPERLRLDGWWLSSSISDQPDSPGEVAAGDGWVGMGKLGTLVALLLVILADWLFWQRTAGVSVALFAIAMSVAMMLARAGTTSRGEWLIVVGLSIVFNLPVVEHLQPLSFLFSALGVASIAIWLAMDRLAGWYQSVGVVLKITFIGPFLAFIDLWGRAEGVRSNRGITRLGVSMVLPLSLGLVFVWLLVAANPFLEKMLAALGNADVISPNAILRLIFWVLVLAFVWPYLNLRLFRVCPRMRALPSMDVPSPALNPLVNAPSVRNSLILFNGIFAFQTGLDLLVLSGGMVLPEGMSYANYAHRGAYPLVATALLAGAFAIGTKAFIVKDRLMRGLVYIWLFQNLFLVLSAAFRLNLYIETYALTYLRVAAFIWMFLVFVGLVLVFFQISRNKSNVWLMTRNSIALLGVLYSSCFVNFAYIIASYNVAHPLSGGRVDTTYICRLGPQALPVILSRQVEQNEQFCQHYHMPVYYSTEGWRDWGFRNWRLQRYLNSEFQYQVSYEHSNSGR